MARSRNIKPSIFKNELLGEADPLLTILFAGLWCLADREGRLEDRPKRIKAEIFPYREGIEINGYLTQLERLEFIHRYSCQNIDVIQIINFKKHQNPHNTEKQSELPEFKKTSTESNSSDTCVNVALNNGYLTDEAVLIPDSLNLIPDSIKNTKTKFVLVDDLISLGCDPVESADWLAIRKKKLTATALKTIINESSKANITLNSAISIMASNQWQGFKSVWMENRTQKNAIQAPCDDFIERQTSRDWAKPFLDQGESK